MMQICKKFLDNRVLLGVQGIEGNRDSLLEKLPVTQREDARCHIMKMGSDRRVNEWLATRVLLYELTGKDVSILYHDDGSPYLSDDSCNISISHSNDYVAVLLSSTLKVGVDIEGISERIFKIRERFVNEEEFIDTDNELIHLLLHWSGKETLFKLMKKREVDFKKHLFVVPFKPKQSGVFEAIELRTALKRRFEVHYEVFDDLVLTWATVE